jgi:hypothetical protein
MKLDELIVLGWEDVPDHFSKRDTLYGTTECKISAVIQPHTDNDTTIPSPTIFGEPLVTLQSILSKSHMPQVASRPGSCHIRLGSGTPRHLYAFRLSRVMLRMLFHQLTNRSLLNPYEGYRCIYCPKLITIVTSDLDKEMVAAPVSSEE